MRVEINKTPVVLSIVMLFLAIFPFSYGYYTLLRLVVSGTAIYLTWFAKTIKRQGWMWIMGFLALLFNPIIPIYLNREIWVFIDLLVVFTLFVALFKLNNIKKE